MDVFYSCLVFFLVFLLGAITGLFLANGGTDVVLHDTYFIVGHFHYVLSLGAVLGIISGVTFFIIH